MFDLASPETAQLVPASVDAPSPPVSPGRRIATAWQSGTLSTPDDLAAAIDRAARTEALIAMRAESA